jgi:hypothetical protein
MRNKKVIVINGMARGGTNILWNILQSHPHVCSPIYETGQIIPNLFNHIPWANESILTNSPILRRPIVYIVGTVIDRKLSLLKLKNLEPCGVDNRYGENRFEYEGIPYDKERIRNAVLCLKSNNEDIFFNELISIIFEECFFVGLIRNGYALCEGWVRRGAAPAEVGFLYRKYGEKIIGDSKEYQHYVIVKFENLLANPFDKASELFRYAKLEPTCLEKLRLTVKKVVTRNGARIIPYGTYRRKYWFTSQTIREILIPNISDIQAERLSPSDRKAFEREARPVLDYFGYT